MAATATNRPDSTASAVDKALLAGLYLFVALALIGFGTFGLHPELVARVPGAAKSYGLVFQHVGQVQVWIGFLVLAAVLWRHARTRWLAAFAAVYAISLSSELLGTSSGIPFGGYQYTGLLGWKWLGLVPAVIPLSWFAMAVPSYALARLGRPQRGRVARVLLASGFLVAWDLALDPAMSFLTPYWIWADTGPYYGMPWVNLAGWYLTAVVLFTALSVLKADRWIDRLPVRWLGGYYGANLLMPVGMLAAAGHWLGVVVTAAAYVALAGLLAVRTDRRRVLFPAQADARS